MHATKETLRLAAAHATELITRVSPADFPYHTLDHTLGVIDMVREIGKASDWSKRELITVSLAAWFHDTGVPQTPTNPQEASGQVARDFLIQHEVDPEQIELVVACIRATRLPQSPQDDLAKALCDADLAHLGKKDFFERTELLRQEQEIQQGYCITPTEWEERDIHLLRDHTYFTNYGRDELAPRQKKNLEQLLFNRERIKPYLRQLKQLTKENGRLVSKLDEERGKQNKGIETMFRTMSRNHIELSNIADNKANIMISINAIIISLMVSVVIRKFDEFPNLIIPTALLTLVCTITIIYAVLATRPTVTHGTFTMEDVQAGRTNLLFFGNFHNMTREAYQEGIHGLLENADLLYHHLTNDVYYLGLVLAHKYRLIRISYTVFMYGFALTVLAYVIAVSWQPFAQPIVAGRIQP
ncbi:Pycsar system effector family protein [Spirosoma arcticum]